jgi:hypothetical protein
MYGLQNTEDGPKTGQPKGTSIDDEASWKLAIYLHPVSDLQWFRHGSLRPHCMAELISLNPSLPL